MEVVGHHLQIEALAIHKDGGEGDLFARSAFNRYYYAAFLTVRDHFILMSIPTSKLVHANYPDVIEGTIIKQIKEGRKKAQRVNDTKLVERCQQAINAAKSLSSLMQVGYSVRVVADYRPDIKIVFEEAGRFNLNGIDITSAHHWPSQAKIFAASIAATWRQIVV